MDVMSTIVQQYAFTGTGMDLPLLQWLETHTFPVEARFADPSFARKVRTAVAAPVATLLEAGPIFPRKVRTAVASTVATSVATLLE